MSKRDYYEILGVSKNASQSEIKKSYRKLAKQYHPDKNKAEDAADRFKEVSEAYEILSDEGKRKAYDQFGHAGTQGFGGFGGGEGYNGEPFDMGDIFSQFFGKSGFDFGNFGFNYGGSEKKSSVQHGADLRYRIKMDFLESMGGGEYEIKVQRDITCEKCNGTGSDNGKLMKCATCNGDGRIQQIQQSFLGRMSFVTECPDCNGIGQRPEVLCKVCGGSGLNQKEQKVKIKVPAGAYDGMVLRFRGSGSMGKNGGGSGDLYIEISVESDDRFERRGNDIYSNLSINIPTAVLGDQIDVETVEGVFRLKIPAGTQSGTIFKLKDKGAPIVGREGEKGDHYVKVNIHIPEKISRKEKSLWNQLKEIS